MVCDLAGYDPDNLYRLFLKSLDRDMERRAGRRRAESGAQGVSRASRFDPSVALLSFIPTAKQAVNYALNRFSNRTRCKLIQVNRDSDSSRCLIPQVIPNPRSQRENFRNVTFSLHK